MSPDDTENFLSFIQEIRGQAPNLTYSAAVSVTPFTDSTGAASTNVSGFAGALDWIGKLFTVLNPTESYGVLQKS